MRRLTWDDAVERLNWAAGEDDYVSKHDMVFHRDMDQKQARIDQLRRDGAIPESGDDDEGEPEPEPTQPVASDAVPSSAKRKKRFRNAPDRNISLDERNETELIVDRLQDRVQSESEAVDPAEFTPEVRSKLEQIIRLMEKRHSVV